MTTFHKMVARCGAIAIAVAMLVAVTATGANAVARQCTKSYGVQRCAKVFFHKNGTRKEFAFHGAATDVIGNQTVRIKSLSVEAQQRVNGVWQTFYGYTAAGHQTSQAAAIFVRCGELDAGAKYRSLVIVKFVDNKGKNRTKRVGSYEVWKGRIC